MRIIVFNKDMNLKDVEEKVCLHGVEALEDSIILDVFTPIRKEFLE